MVPLPKWTKVFIAHLNGHTRKLAVIEGRDATIVQKGITLHAFRQSVFEGIFCYDKCWIVGFGKFQKILQPPQFSEHFKDIVKLCRRLRTFLKGSCEVSCTQNWLSTTKIYNDNFYWIGHFQADVVLSLPIINEIIDPYLFLNELTNHWHQLLPPFLPQKESRAEWKWKLIFSCTLWMRTEILPIESKPVFAIFYNSIKLVVLVLHGLHTVSLQRVRKRCCS